MTQLSQQIFERWQVRKTRGQKTAFIEFMQQQLPQLRVEKSWGGRNLVLGDPDTAKVIFTAHYDTCAKLPFPNFITPLNLFLYIGYNVLVCLPFLALLFGMMAVLRGAGMPRLAGNFLSSAVMLGVMLWVLMLGKPNPHTANDNTSGVITLCQLWAALTPAQREKTALVFFDNEENGLLGSAGFSMRHKADVLLINFDCVSDGDYILLALNRRVKKRYGELLRQIYAPAGVKTVLHTTKAVYPSDQANFKLGVGVAALKHKKGVGYYMNKIHTKRDTVFDQRNIDYLTEASVRLVSRL